MQYDHYTLGTVAVSCSLKGSGTPGVEVTPAGYYDVVLGVSNTDQQLIRTSRVFEVPAGNDALVVDFVLNGFVPMVDSLTVATAIDAPIPDPMPIPEPATLALLGAGAIALVRRRR